MIYKAQVTTNTSARNIMECQKGSSNIDTITAFNVSDTHLILMTGTA